MVCLIHLIIYFITLILIINLARSITNSRANVKKDSATHTRKYYVYNH